MIEINYGFLEIEGNERYELHWFNPWESTLRITFNNAISYAKKKKTKTIVELKNYRFGWKILRIFCVVCLHLCHSLVGGEFPKEGNQLHFIYIHYVYSIVLFTVDEIRSSFSLPQFHCLIDCHFASLAVSNSNKIASKPWNWRTVHVWNNCVLKWGINHMKRSIFS